MKPLRYCIINEHCCVLRYIFISHWLWCSTASFCTRTHTTQSTLPSDWLMLFPSQIFSHIHTQILNNRNSSHIPTYEAGTHRVFQNVGIWNSARRSSHKKAHNKIRTVGSITQYSCCVASHLLFRTTPSTHSGRLTNTRHLEQLCR